MLRYFPSIDVFGDLDRIVAGVIHLPVVTLITDSYGCVPISGGHTFRLRRALRAKALSTVSAVMFSIRRTEQGFAVVAVFYLVIRSPVRRCHLIRNPCGQCFRRLQRNARDSFGDVRDPVDHPLRRILRRSRMVRLKERRSLVKSLAWKPRKIKSFPSRYSPCSIRA